MTDPIPFQKDFTFAYGAPNALSGRIRRVIANNPGPFTFTGTGTYIIGSGNVAVIDPGPDLKEHLDAILAAVENERVTHILVTHTHKDHCELAHALAAATGAPILAAGAHPDTKAVDDAPALEEGVDRNFTPDQLISDGDMVSGEDWTLKTVATPGHLSNHLCFSLEEENTLFTGDHIMGWATTVIIPPDGDMGDYMTSLDKLLEREDALYLPTHGAPIERPRRFVRAIRTHRQMRDGQILERVKRGDRRVKEITLRLYADVDKRLHGAAALNVFAHLIRLHRIGAINCDGAPTMNGEYWLA